MTLIDGDRIVTAQLYDDEYELFIDKKMSIIDFINAYTEEEVTMADDILDKIRAEIEEWYCQADKQALAKDPCAVDAMIDLFIRTINKYKTESEERE